MVARDLNFGFGSHVAPLTRHLRKLGVTVDLFTGRGNDLLTNLISYGLNFRDGYDIVHVQGSVYGALRIFENLKVPRVTTIHTLVRTEYFLERNLKNAFGLFFELMTLPSSDAIIIVNQFLAVELGLFYSAIPPERIFFIPNAVDTSEFDRFNGLERHKVVFSCGRDIPRKNFRMLRLACRKANIPLVLAHGELPRDVLIKEYKSASIFVCPSIYETGPITVMEAMAAKCPVICSNIPQVEDLVLHGKTGILFEPRDADDLAFWIQYLINDPDFRQKLAENAYRHVKENFNWETVAKQTLEVYKEVMA